MKGTLLFCSILALASTKPNGYYHQEYNYKSSSSSFKNNELQHQNENQGFYSKDGDLEGRLKPKVNTHSQHSEYTNPKLLSGSSNYQAGLSGYTDGSNGNYRASSEKLFGSNFNNYNSGGTIDGYASSDRVNDLSNVFPSGGHIYPSDRVRDLTVFPSNGQQSFQETSYGSNQRQSYDNYRNSRPSSANQAEGGSNYAYVQGSGGYNNFGFQGANSNLNSLAQRLQDEMTRQLETAVHNQYKSTGYSSSVSSSQMSADVRALEDELKRNLTRQLEDSLRTQYGHQEMRNSNYYTNTDGMPSTVANYNNREIADITRQLEDNLIKKLHEDFRTTYNTKTNSYSSNSYHSNNYGSSSFSTTNRPYNYYERPVVIAPSNIQYTPLSNPESLTQIASRTQSNINTNLDVALQNLYTTYLQSGRSNYYTLTDFNNEADRIKNEIVRNLTANMDDQIRQNYGNQVIKDNYYYSVSNNGATNPQYNYNIRDYENLKRQVEENLLKKLNQSIDTYREQYQRQISYTSNSNAYTATVRPTYYVSGNQVYDYSDLQRKLSQQLQNALNERKYSQSSSYSSSSSYSKPQAYQASYDELSRELQRNLTEQLNNFRASSSSSSSYGGYASSSSAGVNNDFESMKSQLRNQLMQQLQQGLQGQNNRYSASASYSASSASRSDSNYGAHQSYGNYENFVECCTPIKYRRRRSISYKSPGNDEFSGLNYASSTSRKSYFNSNSKFSSNEDHTVQGIPSAEQQESYIRRSYSSQLQSSSYSKHDQNFDSKFPEIIEDVNNKNTFPSQGSSRRSGSSDQQLEIIADDTEHLEQQNQQYTSNVGNHKLSTFSSEDDTSQKLELGNENSYNPKRNFGTEQNNYYSKNEKHDLEDQQLTVQNGNDFTQQFRLTNPEKLRKYTEQSNSEQGYLTQKKRIIEFNSAQQQQDLSSLNQQLETGYSKPNMNIEQQTLQKLDNDQQLLERDELTQQSEVENPLKPKHKHNKLEKQISEDFSQELELGSTTDKSGKLSQKQELEEFPQQRTNDITQNNDLKRYPEKPKINPFSQQTIDNQQQEDLTQKLIGEQEQEDLTSSRQNQKIIDHQAHEDLTQHSIGHYQEQDQTQQLIGQQEQEDLTQQLEIEKKPKSKHDGILEISDSQNLREGKLERPQGQQGTQETLYPKKFEELENNDLTQKLERIDSKTEYSSNNGFIQQQKTIEQELEDLNKQGHKVKYNINDLDQHGIDQTQQLELSRQPKPIDHQNTHYDTNQHLLSPLDQSLDQHTEPKPSGYSKLPTQLTSQQLEDNTRIPNNNNQKIQPINKIITSNSQDFEVTHKKINVETDDDSTQQLEHRDFEPMQKPEKKISPEADISGSDSETKHEINQTPFKPVPSYGPFSSTRDHQIETQSNIIRTSGGSGTSKIPYGQSSYEQRVFTNGHSIGDHSSNSGYGTSGNYEEALRQQDALIDLLKQKVQSQSQDQGSFGQQSFRKTVYVDGRRVSSSENSLFQPSNNNAREFSTFPNTHGINREGSTYSHTYGVNGDQFSLPHTSNVNNGASTYHQTSYGANNEELQDFHRSQPINQYYTGKSTRRTIHLVNGKPVSASEDVRVLKPNGEVVESHHDLPLDSNSLKNSYENALHAGDFSQLDSTNQGVQSYGFTGQTKKKTSVYSNGKLVGSSETTQHLTNPLTTGHDDFSSLGSSSFPESSNYGGHKSVKTSSKYSSSRVVHSSY